MSLHPATALYDPRRLKKEDFLAGFIARNDLADHLLAQLGKSVADGEPRHRLILGARGMGKTSLLRRIAFGIADTPALAAALLPLTFREEQYNVRSLDQLWRNCGEALAEWREQSGDTAGAAALDRALEGPEWRGVEQAGAAFQALMAGTGKRAVLLIDNLDLILDALPAEQHWQWRRHLQAADGPILIGAATQAPRQLGDREAAFYEFLRLERLDALSLAELRLCLERLAQNRREAGAPVLATLRQDPARLRVLHTLTGGNPRILALLYQVLERAESDTVFTDLESLLDQVTPLYKARVEELRTDLQRAMLDAVALHWDPITARKLAEATGEPVTTVSSQLSRLQEAGYVEEVPTSGARSGYQLAERFFNIWYLMRHGTRRTRQRMAWLTGFLAEFFSVDELRDMRGRLAPGEGSQWHPLLAESLDAALERAAAREPAESGEALAEFWNAFIGASVLQASGKAAEAEAGYREAIRLDPHHSWPWNNLGNVLADGLGRHQEAEQAWREAIARDAANPSPRLNLLWFALLRGSLPDAAGRAALSESLPPVGLHLLDAGIALAQDNLGTAMEQLAAALTLPLDADGIGFLDDLLRVLRLAHARGHGEHLIAWFDSSGQAERQAPLYAALVALERGAATLRDINPETRGVAERLYAQLRPRAATPPATPPRKRGRPRRG
jgi:tetratricopeptide (TPR) repeat protein